MTYGFYGGKFLPMHKGHLYCIDQAAQICDHLTVIMFINGEEEFKAIASHYDQTMSIEFRTEQVRRVCSLYSNVDFKIVDVRTCRLADGSEDWDAETPLVREHIPHMDYVFSSEPRYDEYFSRAYPEATHIIIDAKRIKYPISSTMIRAMKMIEEKKEWMV